MPFAIRQWLESVEHGRFVEAHAAAFERNFSTSDDLSDVASEIGIDVLLGELCVSALIDKVKIKKAIEVLLTAKSTTPAESTESAQLPLTTRPVHHTLGVLTPDEQVDKLVTS